MANVYLAWDKLRTSELAVKVLHSELADDSRFSDMFEKETQFMRDLPHPNIVRFYDFGVERQGFRKIVFIVMDYKKGGDLRRLLLKRGKPLSVKETSQALAAVCKALHFAHQSNVLHCDVKPANILLSHAGDHPLEQKDVFLADFGISRWALEQEGGGTPAYMAPELFQGGSVTEKTEIYAMGVTLYEMLSGGNLPFRGDSSSPGTTARERIVWEKQNKPLPPLQQFNPTLSKEVITVVEKALNNNVKLRQKTIIDVWYEFESVRDQNGLSVTPDQQTFAFPPQPSPPPATPQDPVSTPQNIRPTNQPYLFWVRGEKAGQYTPISDQNLTIGRSKKNQLRLMDRTVSRSHAVIIQSRRAFYIRDEGSSLGTYLNGRRIPPDKPILIKDGDQIVIGDSQVLEFRTK